MEKSKQIGSVKRSNGTFWVVILILTAMFGAGILTWNIYRHRDEIPNLPNPDIQETTGRAAKAEGVKGNISSMAPGTTVWTPVVEGTSLILGTVIRSSLGGSVALSTQGNFGLSIEGDAEVVLKDARTTADHGLHTIFIQVKKGTFRAKSTYPGGKGTFMDIETAVARIRLRQGEVGMKIGGDGHGQAWIASGEATILWSDGRRKNMVLRGLEVL